MFGLVYLMAYQHLMEYLMPKFNKNNLYTIIRFQVIISTW